MAWIFEYVATYANACSLLQPCEPLCWSWTYRPAALGKEEASCAMRQAPAVHFSSGELLLLSHSCAWNGIYAFYLTHKFGFLCFAFGACWRELQLCGQTVFGRFWRGDYCPTSVSARPGPKSGSHQLFVCTALRLSDGSREGTPRAPHRGRTYQRQ